MADLTDSHKGKLQNKKASCHSTERLSVQLWVSEPGYRLPPASLAGLLQDAVSLVGTKKDFLQMGKNNYPGNQHEKSAV